MALKQPPVVFGRENICAHFNLPRPVLYKLERLPGAPIARTGGKRTMVVKTLAFITFLNEVDLSDLED